MASVLTKGNGFGPTSSLICRNHEPISNTLDEIRPMSFINRLIELCVINNISFVVISTMSLTLTSKNLNCGKNAYPDPERFPEVGFPRLGRSIHLRLC
jgi:hypothetical protein